MKKFRRITALAIILVLIFSLSLPAAADVIIEPLNDFYDLHRDECDYRYDRNYIVNTDEGHAYSYADPEAKTDAKGLPNGEVLRIGWVYTDKSGTEWGAYYIAMNYGKTQWIRMSDVTVIYDCFSFLEEYEDEIVKCEYGTYKVEASEEKPVIAWSYPGKKAEWSFSYDDVTVGEGISSTYTDENGTLWGYIAYYMGSRNLWICLTDPYAYSVESEKAEPPLKEDPTPEDEIPTVNVDGVSVELKAEPTPIDEIPEADGNTDLLTVIGALVGGVVLVTAVVIALLFGRKAKTEN